MNLAWPSIDVIEASDSDIRMLDILLLDKSGRMRPVPAATLQALPLPPLRAWAGRRGRYGLVTAELLAWLKQRLAAQGGPAQAVEIGAGAGDLGFHLGVTMTDSYQQIDDPITREYLATFWQEPTRPLPDVLKEDAQTAVIQRRPAVVIASWVTQRWLPGEHDGNMHGPREEEILKHCGQYIFIGNENIHGQKRILSLPHETFKFPWLVSRARDQAQNVIYVWKGDL